MVLPMKRMLVTKLPDISQYRVISFDIFDTLLLRNVLKPTDIFKIVEQEIEIKGFAKKRFLAERIARTKTLKKEITLDDIYAELTNLLNLNRSISEKAKLIEIETEKKFLRPNPFIKDLYNLARKEGKIIYMISDMYLPKKVIKELLSKNGYKEYNDLYVSSEHVLVKGDGSLFKKVMEDQNISPNEWLHVGDNEYADIKMAETLGISTFYFPKVYKQAGYDTGSAFDDSYSLAYSIMRAIQINTAFTNPDLPYWEKFAMLNSSSIHYGFASWIANQDLPSNDLYFLARDGYIVKKVYEEFQKKIPAISNIKTHYLYASRMSLQLPSLILTSKDELLYTLLLVNRAFKETVTVKDIMSLVNIPKEQYLPVLKNVGLKTEKDPLTELNRSKFNNLVIKLYPQIKKNLKKKLSLIKEYFKQEGLYKHNKAGFVDIGWRGSVQKSIQDIINKETYGYYLGVVDTAHDAIRKNIKGYLLQYNQPLQISEILHRDIMMFEFIFSAPEGTVLGFKKVGAKIKPVIDKNENPEYIKAVKEMHRGVLTVIKQALPYHKWLKNLTKEEAIEYFVDFINRKAYGDLQQFYKLTNNVGYGSKQTPYLNKYAQSFIKQHRNKFLDEISHSLWKNAFLVEGIENDKDFETFLKSNNLYEIVKLNTSLTQISFKTKLINKIKAFIKIFTPYNALMFFRQPKRAIKVFVRRIKSLLS